MHLPKFKYIASILAILALLGCGQALQRGMLGESYISSARPDIAISVNAMPLMTAGTGICNLTWTGVMGGLPVEMWVAAYGTGGLSPLAIVAQANLPEAWQWDYESTPAFSVNNGNAVVSGRDFYASTFIINPANDPFGALVTGVQSDGEPQLWIVRAFGQRCNFNQNKIILQYREPLPAGITDLNSLPYGQSELVNAFEQRAKTIFKIGEAPAGAHATRAYANDIQWQYMDQKFTGTASRFEVELRK